MGDRNTIIIKKLILTTKSVLRKLRNCYSLLIREMSVMQLAISYIQNAGNLYYTPSHRPS